MNTKKKLVGIINVVYYLFFTVLAYLLLKYVIAYLIPFLISFSVVYIIQPPSIIISKKTKLSKNFVTVGLLIAILFILAFFVYFISSNLFNFIIDLFKNGSGLQDFVIKIFNAIDNLSNNLPRGIGKYITINTQTVLNGLYDYVSKIALGLGESLLKFIPNFLVNFVVTIVAACFFAFEYDNIVKFIKKQLSADSVKFVKQLKQIVNFSVFNLFKGYIIMMLITFFEMLAGLMFLGVKNAVAVAFIIAMVDILPVFGTGIILIPWGIYSVVFSKTYLGIGLLVIYVIYSALRYFTEPKVIGKKVGMSPILSLITIFVGLKFFGVAGLVILPLLTSIIIILNKNELIRLWKE